MLQDARANIQMKEKRLEKYMSTLAAVVENGVATDASGNELSMSGAVLKMGQELRACHARGKRVYFIGNGGSAGISSHMATDYSKNGGIRSSALNDGSVLTCLGNDYGYEHVFAKQLEWHATPGDTIVAISSSGRSPNILNAVAVGRTSGCGVHTLSGFTPDNPLRKLGDINIYLPSHEYGFVEIGHLAVLHAVLDLHLGWAPNAA